MNTLLGKKILVTGGSGFIGSFVVSELLKEDVSEVIIFDNFSRGSNTYIEDQLKDPRCSLVQGDLREIDVLNEAMSKCNYVVHLAAMWLLHCKDFPRTAFDVNIQGTFNVLESSKNSKLDQILITSTSETYGSAKYIPINENHPLQGQSPYAASKIGADQIALSYYNSFNLPVKVIRPFNTYGPRQSLRAIIPTIISQILVNKKEIKLGNTLPRRDFLYVKDTCNGFLAVLKSNKLFGQVVNIGSNKEISIKDLTREVIRITNSKNKIKIKKDTSRTRPKKSEVNRLLCDNSLILKKTEWKPIYDLDKGITETVKWFKDNLSKNKTDIYNI